MKGSPFFNIMMFSAFWAMQIFVTKLALNAGAQVLSYQLLSLLAALVILAVFLLPRFGREFRSLFRDKPDLFWRLFFANGIQSGLGTCLSIIGISLTSAINAGFLVKLSTVTTILFAWLILKERLTVIKILMVFSMLSGAYLLTTKGQILLPRIGDLFILGACVCWSLGNVLIRKYLKSQPVKVEVVTFQKSHIHLDLSQQYLENLKRLLYDFDVHGYPNFCQLAGHNFSGRKNGLDPGNWCGDDHPFRSDHLFQWHFHRLRNGKPAACPIQPDAKEEKRLNQSTQSTFGSPLELPSMLPAGYLHESSQKRVGDESLIHYIFLR